jgi:hypothetical protein
MKRLLFTWPVFVIGLTVGLLGLTFVPEPEYNETPLDDVSYVITAPAQSTTTTTVLPANGDCEALGVFAVSLGWPVTEIETLKKVSYRESRCWHDVINTRDVNGGSYGNMQINGYWCLPNKYWPQGYLQAHGIVTTCTDLLHPKANLLAALQIWYEANNSWRSWATAN